MTVLVIVTITSFGVVSIIMHHYCHHYKTVTFIKFITIFSLPCHTNYSQEPNASVFIFTT